MSQDHFINRFQQSRAGLGMHPEGRIEDNFGKLIFGVFGWGIRIHGAQELAGGPVWASLYSGKARAGLKTLVWVFSLASLASLA
jgi:hypothetical protein